MSDAAATPVQTPPPPLSELPEPAVDPYTRAPLRHEIHDGIQEYDNPMPRWLVAMFYLSLLWGGWYFFYYHVLGSGSLGVEKLVRDGRELTELRAAAAGGALNAELIIAASRDPARVARGAQIYAQANCATCHGADGSGGVAPNLFDRWSLHGSQPLQLADVISNGRAQFGMPKQNLSVEELTGLVAWIGASSRMGGKNGKRAARSDAEVEDPITW